MKRNYLVLASMLLVLFVIVGCYSKNTGSTVVPPAAKPQMIFLTALGSQATGNLQVRRKSMQQAIGVSPLSSLGAFLLFQSTPPLSISMSFSGYCSSLDGQENEVFGIGWLGTGDCGNTGGDVFKTTDGVPVVGDGTLQVFRMYEAPGQSAVMAKVYVNGTATGITCTTPGTPADNKCSDDTTAELVKDGDLVIVTLKGPPGFTPYANIRVMLGKY